MNAFYFDIETGPLPESELLAMLPPFDPLEVKTGNLKDPGKIAEKLAEAEAGHKRDFIDKAALDALTGRVLAIGLKDFQTGEVEFLTEQDEEKLLLDFWCRVYGDMGRINPMIGFNICLFDLPFLIRRSWKHGVRVPAGIRKGRYWGDQVIDLRDVWQLGDRMAKGSLDRVARHLGVGAKTGNGKDFADLFATNREAALEYLKNDLELTAKVGQAMGVVP